MCCFFYVVGCLGEEEGVHWWLLSYQKPTPSTTDDDGKVLFCRKCELRELPRRKQHQTEDEQQTNHIIHVPRLRCSFTWESIEWQPGEPLYSRSEIYGFYGFFAFLLRGGGGEWVDNIVCHEEIKMNEIYFEWALSSQFGEICQLKLALKQTSWFFAVLQEKVDGEMQ